MQSQRWLNNQERIESEESNILKRWREKQYKYFDKKIFLHIDFCEKNIYCPFKTQTCRRYIYCNRCRQSEYNPCSCKKCDEEEFPCVAKKFPCKCNICQKLPDSKVIPEALPIFKRLDLDPSAILFNIFLKPDRAKFNEKILRREICGASAIGTHFAQERFSETHLEKLGIDKNLGLEFEPWGLLPNFKGNLKAWKEHKEVAKAVDKFKKKYHRYPPCFRERMDIRSITKVSLKIAFLIIILLSQMAK
jgi:hypothetical protein